MTDTFLFVVVLVALAIWASVGAYEAVYNRCKRRGVDADYTSAINALSGLVRQHEGWEHGMGACQCAAHKDARKCIKRYHERGKL